MRHRLHVPRPRCLDILAIEMETQLSRRSELLNLHPANGRYLIDPTPRIETASSAALNNLHPDDEAEGSTSHVNGHRDGRNGNRDGDDRDKKRRKFNKKDKTGQNKGRQFPVLREAAVRICRAWETTGECSKGGDCKWAHSWSGYFTVKPRDIHFEMKGALNDSGPEYVTLGAADLGGEDELSKTIDLATQCPVYLDLGYCPFAWRCRFLGGHVRRLSDEEKAGPSKPERMDGWECLGMEREEVTKDGWKRDETNYPPGILHELRTSRVSCCSAQMSNHVGKSS